MRLFDYLYEDAISDALDIDEPEVNKEYSDEYVKKNIEAIKKALSQAKKKDWKDEEVQSTVVADLEDKLEKWENVEKETESVKPPPPAEGEEGEEESVADEIAAEREAESDAKKAEAEAEREEKKAEKEAEDEEKKKKNEGRLIKSIIRRRK